MTPCTASRPGSGRTGNGLSRRSYLSWKEAAISLSWSNLSPRAMALASAGAEPPASSASSSQVSQRSWKLISASIDSTTSKGGGSPISKGRSRRSWPAKLWRVCIEAESNPRIAARHRPLSVSGEPVDSIRERSLDLTRSLSSAAASSVKVMAAILLMVARPVVIRATIRLTKASVFPVPAPASTNKVSSRLDVIRSRCSWS